MTNVDNFIVKVFVVSWFIYVHWVPSATKAFGSKSNSLTTSEAVLPQECGSQLKYWNKLSQTWVIKAENILQKKRNICRDYP